MGWGVTWRCRRSWYLGHDRVSLPRHLSVVRGHVIGLEDLQQLSLGDDSVAVFIESHECKLEFIFFG